MYPAGVVGEWGAERRVCLLSGSAHYAVKHACSGQVSVSSALCFGDLQ